MYLNCLTIVKCIELVLNGVERSSFRHVLYNKVACVKDVCSTAITSVFMHVLDSIMYIIQVYVVGRT